jgi:predicted kinase
MLVTVLSGISGSGKSTYIKHCCGGAEVVSADHYFMDRVTGEYKFNPSKLSEAHGECFRRLIDAINRKVDHIVVDNTNTTESEISPYMLAAQAFGYDAEVIILTAPEGMGQAEYIERCAARNSHGVPPQGVAAQAKRLLERSLPPWWAKETVESQF